MESETEKVEMTPEQELDMILRKLAIKRRIEVLRRRKELDRRFMSERKRRAYTRY